MRYTVGVEINIEFKDGSHENMNGLLISGFCGIHEVLPYNSQSLEKEKTLIVFDSTEDATLYAQAMARSYGKDNSWHGKKIEKMTRNFYPVKIDSANFPFEIKNSKIGERRAFFYNRFAEKTDKRSLTYFYLTGRLISKMTDKSV